MSEILTQVDVSSMPDYSSLGTEGQSEITVLLTEKGLALREARPELEHIFVPEYINQAKVHILGGAAVGSTVGAREYIWRGRDSEVYELAPGVAVKEVTKRADPVASVERMSFLSEIVDEKTPDWISVPDQYGIVIPESTSDAFVAMQKVNSGINVDWLLDQDDLNDFQRKKIERDIGEVGPSVQLEIRSAYSKLENIMCEAVDDIGSTRDEMLPDLEEWNVLVERLPKKIDDMAYKLWVIDQ